MISAGGCSQYLLCWVRLPSMLLDRLSGGWARLKKKKKKAANALCVPVWAHCKQCRTFFVLNVSSRSLGRPWHAQICQMLTRLLRYRVWKQYIYRTTPKTKNKKAAKTGVECSIRLTWKKRQTPPKKKRGRIVRVLLIYFFLISPILFLLHTDLEPEIWHTYPELPYSLVLVRLFYSIALSFLFFLKSFVLFGIRPRVNPDIHSL